MTRTPRKSHLSAVVAMPLERPRPLAIATTDSRQPLAQRPLATVRDVVSAAADPSPVAANTVVPATGGATAEVQRAPSRWSLRRRLMFSFVLAAALIATITWTSDSQVREFQQQATQVAQSVGVKESLARILGDVRSAESAERAFLISGEPDFERSYQALLPRVEAQLEQLRHAVADQPEQRERAQRLGEFIRIRFDRLDQSTATFVEQGLEAARRLIANGAGVAAMYAIEEQVSGMVAAENQIEQQRIEQVAGVGTRLRQINALAVSLCILILLIAYVSVHKEQAQHAATQRALRESNADLQSSLLKSRTLTAQLGQLSALGEMLQSCRGLSEAVAVVKSTLPEILEGCAGSLYLLDADQRQLQLAGGWGEHRRSSRDNFQSGDCWALRRGQVFPPPEGGQGICCLHLDQADGVVHPHHLCLPLNAQGESLGVLYIDAATALVGDRLRLAMAAAEQVSLAMSNLRLQESLRAQSIRDPLTGLFNRRYLDASLPREITRAQRRHAAIAVLMIDVDHFKRFNDLHGHDAGDAVLVRVAEVLTRFSRSEDIACRYGGEEFTLILPEMTRAIALTRAEELRAAVENLQVIFRGHELPRVTISIGVSVFPRDGRIPEDLRRSADQALYRAKQAGRNRVALI